MVLTSINEFSGKIKTRIIMEINNPGPPRGTLDFKYVHGVKAVVGNIIEGKGYRPMRLSKFIILIYVRFLGRISETTLCERLSGGGTLVPPSIGRLCRT